MKKKVLLIIAISISVVACNKTADVKEVKNSLCRYLGVNERIY
jgi:uncharacterized lipoprotein NlpE involved in copper resistance